MSLSLELMRKRAREGGNDRSKERVEKAETSREQRGWTLLGDLCELMENVRAFLKY